MNGFAVGLALNLTRTTNITSLRLATLASFPKPTIKIVYNLTAKQLKGTVCFGF